jgi:hypothetical protein
VHVYVPAHNPVAVAPVPPLGAHEYVYVPLPPAATTVALPVHAPLHVTLTCDCVAVIAGGWVIVNVFVIEHPTGELIVQVYVPAHNPVAVAPVPPDGAHEYVYVPLPPEATTVALPLQAPLQVTFTCDCVAVIAGGCVIVNEEVIEQPAGELIVHVYVPAQSPVAVAPVPPLGAHEYVYVPLPPDATTVALPVHAPLHVTFTCDCVAVIAGGSVIVIVREPVHPFASTTLIVYVPAHSALAVLVAPAVVLAWAGDHVNV